MILYFCKNGGFLKSQSKTKKSKFIHIFYLLLAFEEIFQDEQFNTHPLSRFHVAMASIREFMSSDHKKKNTAQKI